ncbi:MAG: DNA translocase FtsK, partial [Leptolinea sp.]
MNSFNPEDLNPADEFQPDGIDNPSQSIFSVPKTAIFEWKGKDGLGIVLIIVSLLTFFGLTQISSGAFLTPWVQFLKRWLGWGSVLFAFLTGYAGITALRQPHGTKAYPLIQILGSEGMLFSLIALLSVWGGNSVDRAGMGEDGGLVGWGLARMGEFLLPGPLNTLVWLGLLVVTTFATFWPVRKTVIQAVAQGLHKSTRRDWQAGRPVILEKPESVPHSISSLADILAAEGLTKKKTDADHTVTRSAVADPQKQDRLPPINLLSHEQADRPDPHHIHGMAEQIETTLAEFGVPSTVTGYRIGPTVTQYAVEPGFIEKVGIDGNIVRQKIRVAQISALSRDLALALKAKRLRIEAPVPGQSFMGIEIPNSNNAMVRLRPLIESEYFQKMTTPLTLALGKDVSGIPVVADLAKMPHLLVAGTTGSGKSVCISSIITCLIMN